MADASKQLSVAIAQPMAVPGDIDENLRRMEPLLAQAAARGAELAVFSECGITGYDKKNAAVGAALALDDPRLLRVDAMAKQYGMVIVAGFYEKKEDGIYNTAVAFYPDGRRVVQRKHLAVGDEEIRRGVLRGERRREIFTVKGLRLAILICADNGIPGIYEELAGQGVDAVVAPTAGLGSTSFAFYQRDMGNPERRQAYLKAAETVCFLGHAVDTCIKLDMGLACCNQCGWIEETGFFHPGHAAVINRDGNITALIPGRFMAEHLHADLGVGFLTAREPKGS